ncbi:hypothetical protein CDL12_24176 [Handroanthus impetiginosus]|uniref:Uncharacterized protein n=1 Tax=Handroanthus impetiginosus TaxID=429701 RepID=A0A2G9GDD9_9LAMI|nr:hypothetical protein CDL12_24176 [Handroanthus impetiginosus]
MSGGGGGLSKLGIALTIIFVISLIALFAQLIYAFWRRRVFRHQSNTGGGGGGADHLSIYSSSDSTFSSKELLYFFCIRSHSRLESSTITATSSNHDPNSNRQLDMEVVDIDLLKLQGMFGPPRFLFTIKEEEKEDLESPADKSLHSAGKAAKEIPEGNRNNRLSLEECFKAAEEPVVELEIIDGAGGHETTPFSTPCASPVYFTPSASPVHDVVDDEAVEEDRISSESRTGSFLRPQV